MVALPPLEVRRSYHRSGRFRFAVSCRILATRSRRSIMITVYGAGAIGGVTGAALARAGRDVLLVDQVVDHVAAMNSRGLTIETRDGDWRAPGVIQHGGDGAFVVGELDGTPSARVRELAGLLGAVTGTRVSDNVWG